jgi:hypothetical protein
MTDRGPARHGALASGLLARKGQARPAMRPQTAALEPEDDLGWNDMGDSAPEPALPPVLLQQKALQAEYPAEEPEADLTALKTRAAFTLRLDAERHLRLRLAATVAGVSAQTLMTLALDQYLQTIPEVEALANQVPARPRRSSVGGVR